MADEGQGVIGGDGDSAGDGHSERNGPGGLIVGTMIAGTGLLVSTAWGGMWQRSGQGVYDGTMVG